MATTIRLEERTKDRLDKIKHENESYDTAVNRAIDDNPGVLFTEEEVRSMARAEAKDMIRQFGGGR